MEKKKPTICLLGASFGTDNMGVNALTAGTLKAFFAAYPDGELFLFDYGKKEETYTFQVEKKIVRTELVNIRFSKKFYLKNNIALLIVRALLAKGIPFDRIRGKMISGSLSLRRMAESDVVVSVAGGDSFSDIYGMGRFWYVTLPQLLALLLGKQLILLPQTIGPFQGNVAKRIAKSILRRATVIYSRDRAGVEKTKDLLGPGKADDKVRFCYDLGFVVDPAKPGAADLDGLPERKGEHSPLVGFNISGLLYMGGYTQNNMFGLKTDYRRLVSGIIEHFIQGKGAAVLLVPHVFGAKDLGESDVAACELVYAELKQKYGTKLRMVRGAYNQSEIKHIVGFCDFFIGSRMHACIAALSQNIPAVGIAYSRKFIGVLDTIGAESCVVDPRELDSDAILAVIDRTYDRRTLIRQQLKETMPKVKETVLKLFPEIMASLSDGGSLL